MSHYADEEPPREVPDECDEPQRDVQGEEHQKLLNEMTKMLIRCIDMQIELEKADWGSISHEDK